MSPESHSENRLFVDGVLRDAGIDLWGAAANVPALPLAPALPTAISLLARLDLRTLTRLEQGDLAAYGNEYRRVNALLDAAAGELVAALLDRGCEVSGTSATVYEPLPPSGNWLAAGVFAHKTAATRAGLGWIGKTGLFVSPEAGPKLRLTTVFTDLALPSARRSPRADAEAAAPVFRPVRRAPVATSSGRPVWLASCSSTRPPANVTWMASRCRATRSAACVWRPVRSAAHARRRALTHREDAEADMKWRKPPAAEVADHVDELGVAGHDHLAVLVERPLDRLELAQHLGVARRSTCRPPR
jgi:hypothetical protein